jgi:hypothetical protein
VAGQSYSGPTEGTTATKMHSNFAKFQIIQNAICGDWVTEDLADPILAAPDGIHKGRRVFWVVF